MTNEKEISLLSELRSKYSCFDEKEEPYYQALSLGIKCIKALEQVPNETIHGSTYGGVSWGGTYKSQEPCNTDTCKVVKAYMNEWDKPNNSDVEADR